MTLDQIPDLWWLPVALLAAMWAWRISRPRRSVQRPATPHRHSCVYRMFNDERRELLYVGVTSNLPRRIARHAAGQPWWWQVTTITVAHFPDRPTADAAEKTAIRRERPRYNIAGRHRNRRRVYR